MDAASGILLVIGIVTSIGLVFVAALAIASKYEQMVAAFEDLKSRLMLWWQSRQQPAAANADFGPDPVIQPSSTAQASSVIPSAAEANNGAHPTMVVSASDAVPEALGPESAGERCAITTALETPVVAWNDHTRTPGTALAIADIKHEQQIDAVPAVRATPPLPTREVLADQIAPRSVIPVAVINAAPHLAHFGLKEDPFTLTPDPAYWVSTRTHREAAAKLQYGIQTRKGCMALIGDVGLGKTLVLEYLTEIFKTAGIEFALIVNSRLTVEEFYEALSVDLGLDCPTRGKVQMLVALQERVAEIAARGSTTALLIDNAHRLTEAVLEEIDLLGNLESRRAKLVQVILAGQPNLDAKLDAAGLASLRQRIAGRAMLAALDGAESAAYLQARAEKAGAADLFPQPVSQAIWSRCRGVPRVTNMLASAVIERAFQQNRRELTAELVDAAAQEIGLEKPAS